MIKKIATYLVFFLMVLTKVSAQEDNPFVPYDVPAQNLLKFNRFLINPTFSTVREDKSYINLLHRNQSATFDDNNQDYFLSYSGRINDRAGLGLSLFTQREGAVSNYGVLANYAYGIKLSDKSNFTFGANVSYYNSGLDRSRINTLDPNDPLLDTQDSNLLSFQPGFNLSYGNFDFGVFAENLFDYNLKSSESVTAFKDKTFSAHLQYTHQFKNASGIFESGRLMPLARARKVGEDEIVLGGSLILDLPKLGWLQTGYDNFYGASAGIGFNLGRRISLGYTMEKGLSSNFDNFGVTHEISFAYSFTPNLTEDRVMLEDNTDALANNPEPMEKDSLRSKDDEIEALKKKLEENDAILAELMFRQDSLENNRQKDLERRFEMVMKMVRNETNGKRPDLEEKAKKMYFINNDKNAGHTLLAGNTKMENVKNPTDRTTVKDRDIVIAENTGANKKPIGIKEVLQTKRPLSKSVRTQQYPTPSNTTDKDNFAAVTKQNHIKGRKFRDLNGVDEGYYIVANVYKGEHYLNKFVNGLNDKGVQAAYFANPKNGLKYVYLERYDTWQEALNAYKSNVNGTYNGDKWIMNVDNGSYTDKAYVSNTAKRKDRASLYNTNILQKNVIAKDNVVATANTPKAKNYKLKGVGSGFYIIANVFANPKNATRFVKLLNAHGLNAGYFINPKNNYRYVYLKKHSSWNNALLSYYTKLNQTYDDQMWIMRVTPNLLS